MGDPRAQALAKHHQIEDPVPLSEELKDKARWLIASNAQGETLAEQVADAELLMMALGVHPSQEPDPEYRISYANLPNPASQAAVSPLMRGGWE